MPDLTFKKRGAVALLRAESTRGQNWLDKNIDARRATWREGSIVVKPPRRALTLAKRAMRDGLVIE
jgi:hypothetical protein